MYEKELGLMAKLIPHLAARWRWPLDLEILADLPDGEVAIDVLTGAARHAQTGPIDLRLSEELRAGFADQLARKCVPDGFVRKAGLTLRMDTGAVRTDRKRIVHFDFRFAALLATEAGEFTAEQEELHVWHSREPE